MKGVQDRGDGRKGNFTGPGPVTARSRLQLVEVAGVMALRNSAACILHHSDYNWITPQCKPAHTGNAIGHRGAILSDTVSAN